MTDRNQLIDAGSGAERFRVVELIATGRSYQVVRVEDASEPGRAKPLCARAVLYDTELAEDPEYTEGRRRAMQAEWEFLHQVKSPLLPEPVAIFEAAQSGAFEAEMPDDSVESAGEPVLVYEYREGLTVFEWIRREHPEGLPTKDALGLLADLVEFLRVVHKAGYLFRDLDPRHIILDPQQPAKIGGVVGFGNATKLSQRPNPHKLLYDGSPYVAPEIRGDRSGTMLRPSADSYALGALMSFILTGEEPRPLVENPLGHLAYDRLSNLDPPGLALLVARLMRPLGKDRIGRMEKLQKFITPAGLPTMHTEGFGMLLLPAPYSVVEDPKNNRSLRSKLSAGPLISVAKDPNHMVSESVSGAGFHEEKQSHGDHRMPASWAVAAAVLGLVSVAVLIACGII